jgi:hypothetical protein
MSVSNELMDGPRVSDCSPTKIAGSNPVKGNNQCWYILYRRLVFRDGNVSNTSEILISVIVKYTMADAYHLSLHHVLNFA